MSQGEANGWLCANEEQQMLNLSPKAIGAIAGLVAGLVVLCFGILKAILLALFILAGWLIARIWTGDIDLIDIYERFMSSRGRRPRS